MKKFKIIIIAVVGLIALILAGVFAVNSVENKAIGLEEQINAANSDIKIQEKRRLDLVYNLVDCVKEYDSHEYKTLKDVTDSRSKGKGDIKEVTTMINAAAEAYPELKSNPNYKQLMNELSITENMIAEHRSNLNKEIKQYNRYVKKFPNKEILNMLGYTTIDIKYLDYNAPQDAPQKLFK
ncbi:MAG: LemA family protein [Clostridium sp.]